MKQLARKAAALFLLVCTLGGLTACGINDFDAAGYVEAYMEAVYNQKYESYAKFTEQTVAEAKAGIVEIEKEDLASSYADMDLTDEDLDEYYQVINKVYNKVKYEVIEAKETKDKNYTVTIEIEPMDTFATFDNNLEEKITEEYADVTEVPSNQEILKFTSNYLLECSENVTYGDPVTIEVDVTHDDDNVYSISDEDLQAIETALMPIA